MDVLTASVRLRTTFGKRSGIENPIAGVARAPAALRKLLESVGGIENPAGAPDASLMTLLPKTATMAHILFNPLRVHSWSI